MTLPFEASRSYVYNAARYELLPCIAEIARSYGDEPFLLREISKRVLAETYSPEQLEIKVKGEMTLQRNSAPSSGFTFLPCGKPESFRKPGGGMFCNISLEDEIAEADAVATDVDSNDAGIIYAYSFPSISRKDGKFPMKVGLTTTGDAEARVAQQCKQTCCFEYPVVLKTWRFNGCGCRGCHPLDPLRLADRNAGSRNGMVRHHARRSR